MGNPVTPPPLLTADLVCRVKTLHVVGNREGRDYVCVWGGGDKHAADQAGQKLGRTEKVTSLAAVFV